MWCVESVCGARRRSGSLWLWLCLLLLVLIQAEARVTALALGRGEAAAGTGPLGDLLLFGALLCRFFAIKQLELLQHRLLLTAADRRLCRRGLVVVLVATAAIRRRVQVVVREIRGLLQHRRTSAPGNMKRSELIIIIFICCTLQVMRYAYSLYAYALLVMSGICDLTVCAFPVWGEYRQYRLISCRQEDTEDDREKWSETE